jgi:hypothetical protein
MPSDLDSKIDLGSKSDFFERPSRTHTVSFNTSTNYCLQPPITVFHGDVLDKPYPEMQDCELVDWYEDRDFRKRYGFNLPVIADFVLYAKWRFIQQQHEVCFDSASRGIEVELVVHGQKVKRPPDPEWKGYDFGGWYLTDMPIEAYYYLFDTPVTQNIALCAMWTEQRPIGGSGPIDPIRPIRE